ncbi:MAG: peptidoglycan-binding protein [Lachnospiraceae bacterium]|nr:peptidoglycan-binding protein [Lachnospiraceae bacterium]
MEVDLTSGENIGSSGELSVEIYGRDTGRPLPGATVSIYNTTDGTLIRTFTADEAGQIPLLRLQSPPIEYSLEPGAAQPYSQYNITVQAAGYEPLEIIDAEVFPDQLALQPILLNPLAGKVPVEEEIIVPGNTLFVPSTPKIPEAEIKPVTETGEIVLSRVVIPEYVVVHDGVPSDRNARDYYVTYRDYVKNVASSEVYATWPEAAIRANVLAIMSFTLNRVYTEWYRGKGYDFTITSSTAYDQKWSYGRTVFESISQIVDEMYNNYLSRPNVRQPILTQYCDGKNVTCPNWMSQWGSKSLADQGLRTIEILRYYYGNDMFINTAEEISGIPSSWPGELSIGSSGSKVRQLQEQLNAISNNYPAIPKVNEDGVYGPLTAESVEEFQSIFGLPVTGVVDYRTWYKISQIYVGVTGIAEL